MTDLNRREFLHASAASLLLSGVTSFAAHGNAGQIGESTPAFVRTNAGGKSWTVGNTLVEREIQFDPQQGLRTVSWRHKVTGTDFVAVRSSRGTKAEEFSFMVNSDLFVGSSERAWELIEAKTQSLTPNGQLLVIELRSAAKPIEVAVFYAVYDAHPVVRKWIGVTNSGKDPVTVSHLKFESVGIAPGPPSVLQAAEFYAILPRELFVTGRVDDCAVLERNSLTGEGLIAMNEAPGWTKRTELEGWGASVQLMYDTDLFPLEHVLEPGKTFTSAKGAIAFFADGKGFADPGWVMPSYTSRILMRKAPGFQPPWVYNTYEPFHTPPKTSVVMELIDAASRMGMDVFTIDDGWQTDYGENTINRKLFPNGLDEILAAVEDKGMRLGLWVPLAPVSKNSTVYREHPEWICKNRDGNPKFTSVNAGAQAVMCLDTPYRDVAAKRISDLIGRYHLAYVKTDLTTVFNAYGESPGCYAQNHDHHSWAESITGIYDGIKYVTDQIYRDHPDVLLDLSFELWGQKHAIDYGLLDAGDVDWLSNVDDDRPEAAGPRQARTLLYQRSLAIPSEAMLIGNLQAEMGLMEERLGTAIGATPLLLGDLRKLTPEKLAWYGAKIGWFKQLRREVPMFEGFFPLGNWSQPGAATWDGFARLSRRGEGMIVLFKNESQLNEVTVALPAFPDGTFHLRSAMTGREQDRYAGQHLRQGIRLHFPSDQKVEILEIRRNIS